jgi:hypothetical protein
MEKVKDAIQWTTDSRKLGIKVDPEKHETRGNEKGQSLIVLVFRAD